MPKISAYSQLITPQDDLSVVLAETDIQDRKVVTDVVSRWIGINESWAYASATTITVPSGAASRYQKGDALRLKQGAGYKYFYIVTVADTLLTVTGGTDYTVANAAITNIYISRGPRPFGFPDWFNWTPALTASAGTYTLNTLTNARFRITGKRVDFQIYVNGTLSGTPLSARFSLPVTAAHAFAQAIGSGLAATTGKILSLSLVSTTVAAAIHYDASNWPTGANAILDAFGFYEF